MKKDRKPTRLKNHLGSHKLSRIKNNASPKSYKANVSNERRKGTRQANAASALIPNTLAAAG